MIGNLEEEIKNCIYKAGDNPRFDKDSFHEHFKIAIVGCGAAGVATLLSLIDSLPYKFSKKFEITIFERGSVFGPGLAYQCDSDELLMNMVSSTTSIIQNTESDFWNWMLEEGCQSANDQIYSKSGIAPDGYIPRAYFGAYLKSRLESGFLALKNLGIKIHLINSEVHDVQVISNRRFKINSNDGCCREFNSVILCIGNQSPEDLFHLKGKNQYINNPYPTNRYLQLIKNTESVGIIGGQLTATDIAVVLANQGHKGPIYFFTRDSNFPLIRSIAKKYRLKYLTNRSLEDLKNNNKDGISVRQILRLARKEFMLAGDQSFLY